MQTAAELISAVDACLYGSGSSVTVYRADKLVVEESNSVYNAIIFFNKLKPNTVYRLNIADIQVLRGKTSEISFSIKDTKKNASVFSKAFQIGKKNSLVFKTDDNVRHLELKLYSGIINKANNISVKFSGVELSEIYLNIQEEDLLFRYKFDSIYSGFIVANKYCDLDSEHFYIIINRHIGDSMNYLSYIKAFRDYYGNKTERVHFNNKERMSYFTKARFCRKITVLTTKSISGVARLYASDIDEIRVLQRSELNALERYATSSLAIHNNIIPDENAMSLDYGFQETTWTKKRMFGVDDHMWDLGLPRNARRTNMVITDKTIKATNELIEKLEIDIENTIVICPVALSSSMLDVKIWEDFAAIQTKKGKKVFTNIAGNEKCIIGTEPLEVDVDILCCLASYGCKIIGVQCGLLDVLCRYSINLPITVVHPIITNGDRRYAAIRNVTDTVVHLGEQTDIKIERFDHDYIVDLLNQNIG